MSGTAQDNIQVIPANSRNVAAILALEEAQAQARMHQLMASGMGEEAAREKAFASAWTAEDLYAAISDRMSCTNGFVALKGKDVLGYVICERDRKQERIYRLIAQNDDPAVQAQLLEFVQRQPGHGALYCMVDVSDPKMAHALEHKGFVIDRIVPNYFKRDFPAYLMQWSSKDVPHIEIDLKPNSLMEQSRYSARQANGMYKPLDPGIIYAVRDQLWERTGLEWNVYCPGNDGKLRMVNSSENMEEAPGLYLMTSGAIADARFSNKRLAHECYPGDIRPHTPMIDHFNLKRGFLSVKALQPVKAQIPEEVKFLHPATEAGWAADIKSESTSSVNRVYPFLR